MGSFEDFIRYGFPGYLLIFSIIFLLAHNGIICLDKDSLKDYATIVGAIILVIGPLVGFLIHQVYFVYFDWRESYVKTSRGCIAFIFHSFLSSKYFKKNSYTKEDVMRNCFVAWKFLTTNYEDDFKIESIFLSRLRNLRNYSHGFGAIILSSILSIGMLVLISILEFKFSYYLVIFLVFHISIFILFYSKRNELLKRITEIEVGIAMLNKSKFVKYMNMLLKLEHKNIDILNKVR
jgi:hypothetical protein